jgi:CheY-like chemotaxis protein
MTLQFLLVSHDDSAADVLGRALSTMEIAVDRYSDPETAVARIEQQKFDALILDFDNADTAAEVLQAARRVGSGQAPLTIALLADAAKVREVLSSGAHFVLYKPVSDQSVKAGLRPAAALLSQERRRAFRVPVQAPVEITLADTRKVDGILLDLSETGMDVLTAEPQFPGALLSFSFRLPDGALEVAAHGQVAWANQNGQTGVHFVDVPEETKAALRNWLRSAVTTNGQGQEDSVPHCKLTDLSLGGCYVETDAPFPEKSLVDLCLRAGDTEVHTEGMVRVAHPSHGMGVEFPSRTEQQRAQVENVINFLRTYPASAPELFVSPRALVADAAQFVSPSSQQDSPHGEADQELEDALLELLHRGASLGQDDFLAELRKQRNTEAVNT